MIKSEEDLNADFDQTIRFVEGIERLFKSIFFGEKTYFISYVRYMFWSTIVYKYHDTYLFFLFSALQPADSMIPDISVLLANNQFLGEEKELYFIQGLF